MKKLFLLLITAVAAVFSSFTIACAQTDPREAELRRLENMEREATMRGDSAVLFGKIWSNEMVVNTPANRVGTVEGTKMQLRTGNLAYNSFVRNIEKITFNDNIALVMGEEITKPQGIQQHAGKTVTRRFTNIWKFANNQWFMIGRQATIIKVE
ncbi:MAG: nuclear transport factor 2 family protein [Spirosomataceae bacterium]